MAELAPPPSEPSPPMAPSQPPAPVGMATPGHGYAYGPAPGPVASPWQGPAQPSDPAPVRQLRWPNRLIVLLLFAAVALVIATLVPSFARQIGATHTSSASRTPLPTGPEAPLSGDPWADLYDGETPGRLANPHAEVGADNIELGLSLRPLTLRAQPETTAEGVGDVPEGTMVMVLMRRGDWVKVVARAGDNAVAGWAQSAHLMIR